VKPVYSGHHSDLLKVSTMERCSFYESFHVSHDRTCSIDMLRYG